MLNERNTPRNVSIIGPNQWTWPKWQMGAKDQAPKPAVKVVFNSLLLFPSCSMGNFFTYQKFHSRKWKIKSTWRTHVNQRQEIRNIKSLEPQRFFKNLQFLPIDKTTFFFKFWLACNHPTPSSSFVLFIFLHHAFYFYCFGKENETTVLKVKKLKKRHVCLNEIARYSHISKQHKNDKELPYGCSIKYYPTDLKKKKKKGSRDDYCFSGEY